MRKIVIEIEVDSFASLDALKGDLAQEISCCVNYFETENMRLYEASESPFRWRSKPLPRATHCIVAIKWAPDDIEVTEADTTFLPKEQAERVVAWMPLPDPPKEGEKK